MPTQLSIKQKQAKAKEYISFLSRNDKHEPVNKPILHWEKIKDQCVLITEEGFFANAYLYKPLNLAIKKMKIIWPSRIRREISILDKLTPIFPLYLCEYQLMENNVFSGLSMKYFKGQKWDDLISDEKNIFKISPVARIRLISKLGQITKQIQQMNICHGDLHMANVLIQVDEKSSLIDPQFQVFLVDYGNGFKFQRGQLVSEGLTGFDCFIPPQTVKNGRENYEPRGVNAYQFGRAALNLLLLGRYKNYHYISPSADEELTQLRAREEYPIQLTTYIQSLIDSDVEARTRALMNLNLAKVEEQTRQLLLECIKRQTSK